MQKIDADKLAQNIARKLLDVYHPQKVVLFGSAVKSGNAEINDLDFFIVKDDVPQRGIDRIRQLRSLVDTDVATDFLIITKKELQQRQAMGDPFIMEILSQGKTLYPQPSGR